jgi:hypothetical protein
LKQHKKQKSRILGPAHFALFEWVRQSHDRMEVCPMEGWIGGNTGPIWPQEQNVFSDMTAIALVNTASGIILAADGRSRWGEESTRDEHVREKESDEEQKVFGGSFETLEIAWAVTGNVFNKDRTFSLIDKTKEALNFANGAFHQGFSEWLSLFAFRLRKSVSEAREQELISPFTENLNVPVGSPERFTFARVVMAGYFVKREPSNVIVRLSHADGILKDPHKSHISPQDMFFGSLEIAQRYIDKDHEDQRFRKYFRPSGHTLNDGLANAVGYIEACSDPLAAELDPLCKIIGGHIHAAALTPAGFRWLIEPKKTPAAQI